MNGSWPEDIGHDKADGFVIAIDLPSGAGACEQFDGNRARAFAGASRAKDAGCIEDWRQSSVDRTMRVC